MKGPDSLRAKGIAAVILAAGSSRRLPGGVPKQLLVIDGEPLVCRTLRTVLAALPSSIDAGPSVRVITGYRGDDVRCAVDSFLADDGRAAGLPKGTVKCLHNPRYAEGQSTSVRCAVEHLLETTRAVGAYFLPIDQPAMDAQVLEQLQDAHARGYGKIIVPTHRGRRGAPVLFDRTFFPQLLQLEGDQGGRVLLEQHPEQIHYLELSSPRPLEDIDTPRDLARWHRDTD